MNRKKLTNPFEISGDWYKANLHSHTTTSDGALSLADRINQYRQAGYDVIAITDHHTTNDVSGLSDKKMLVVSGMEYHPPCPTVADSYHILALNVPHGFSFENPEDPIRCLAQVTEAGGINILAHPYWSGMAMEDFRRLMDGFAAMEVYNSTCDRHGKASSENEWAYCLDHGHAIPIVGNDDVHCAYGEDVFDCWTWLKMSAPTAANVIKAVRTGACYASCGPKIHDFGISRGKVRLRCSAAAKIYFIGGPMGSGVRRRAEDGKSIAAFSMDVPDWPYVRAVVVDSSGYKAWTNPIILKGWRKN